MLRTDPTPHLILSIHFQQAPAGSSSEERLVRDAIGKTAIDVASPIVGVPTQPVGAQSFTHPPPPPPPPPPIPRIVPEVTNVAAEINKEPLTGQANNNINDIPTPINVQRFIKLLDGYDQNLVDYLEDGLTNGFRLEIDPDAQFDSIDTPPQDYNHQSALRHSDMVQEKIDKEVAAGRMEGPFDKIPYDNYKISPIGAVEKKTPGEYRIIHNLSWPAEESVNDFIDVADGKCKYQTMDMILDSLVESGPETNLAVFDIKHAYKVLPIHPDDVPKMGICFNGKFYFDKTLAMGCRTSAKIFEIFSTALEWILKNKFQLRPLHHVLDDFCLLTKPAVLSPQQAKIFTDVCDYLGIPLKIEKQKSGFVVVCLGFELDSVLMQARLPEDKLSKAEAKLTDLVQKESVQRFKLESLVGLLAFACKVVRPGRAFLRRAYTVIAKTPSQFHHIKLNHELKSDLRMWLKFLKSFNGVYLFHEREWLSSTVLQCYTDASNMGYGLVFGHKWVYGSFPDSWSRLNIALREAYPVMLLFEMFGQELKQKKLILKIDNEALVSMLNDTTSKNPSIMVLIRHIVLKTMEHNVVYKASWLATKENYLADALSRLQVQRFKDKAKKQGLEVEPNPTPVPRHLLPHNYRLR